MFIMRVKRYILQSISNKGIQMNQGLPLKQAMFYENGQPLKDPFTQKTYLDMTDEEFDESRVWVVNTKCFQSFFGLLEHDRNEFATIVRSVRENEEKSLFPDFVFANERVPKDT